MILKLCHLNFPSQLPDVLLDIDKSLEPVQALRVRYHRAHSEGLTANQFLYWQLGLFSVDCHRDCRAFEDVARHVARAQLLSDMLSYLILKLARKLCRWFKFDEEKNLLVAVLRTPLTNAQAVFNLGEMCDSIVDLGTAKSNTYTGRERIIPLFSL